METMPTESNERREISKVLLALENAAKLPNFHEVDLSDAFRKENWNIFQNVYGGDKGFVNDEDRRILLADATWPNRLKESTYETCNIYRMLKALRSAADELLLDFETSQERVAAVKRSKGMKSLPDEILSKTFLMAFWGQHSHRASARQAIWLSGVSRRFRNVALGTRGLWTILSSSFSRLQLETLITRAGSNEGFHVFLNLDSFREQRELFEICKSIIPRWKTLTLEHDKEYGNGYHGALENLSTLFVEDGLSSHILEELNVHGDTMCRPRNGVLLPPDVRGWAPNLRALRCSLFLPSLSSPIHSISTLVISTDISHYSYASDPPAQMLLSLLLKLPNLSSFELEAQGAYREAGIGAALPVTECPIISSFQLRIQRIPLLDFPDNGSHIHVAKFMDAIRMPSLEEYIVSIDTWDIGENESECTKWSRAASFLSRALLPARLLPSTRMKSACFKLLNDEGEHWQADEEFRAPLDARELRIPLERILLIPSLSLTSFVPVLFIQETDDKYMDSVRNVSEHPSRRLRELKFIECENMTSAHLERTIRSLEALGVWNDIERVVIHDCKLLMRKDAMEVIGEERLEYLDVDRRADLVGPRASRDYDLNSLY